MDSLSSHTYIFANALARKISVIADEHFKPYGFTSSYAFLILAVSRYKDVGQKDIGTEFYLAPSTVTRFVDKMVKMDLLERQQDGKEVRLVLTNQGQKTAQLLEDELLLLNARISELLGEKYHDTLNRMLKHGINIIDEKNE